MARVPITEYAAKKLILRDASSAVTLTQATTSADLESLPEGAYILKVDTGIKKRGKAGLVKINVSKQELLAEAKVFFEKGYGRAIAEPMYPHKESDERYLSIDLGREDAAILQSNAGGIAIEEHHDTLKRFSIPRAQALGGTVSEPTIPGVDLSALLSAMVANHFSFLEVNPYVIGEDGFHALDMAVEIDSAKAESLPSWTKDHHVDHLSTDEERAVRTQDSGSQASLNLRVLNPEGSILTLLSGGGASLVAMDALVSAGLQGEIINYSEYSGAPTRDETHAYVATLLSVLFRSTSKKKVILIAGGVSNFTDIKETLVGIMDAFSDLLPKLKEQQIAVCIRRGGPNQEVALNLFKTFLETHGIKGEVHGPEISLGTVGEIVKKYLV